jgi:hypothetical protein
VWPQVSQCMSFSCQPTTSPSDSGWPAKYLGMDYPRSTPDTRCTLDKVAGTHYSLDNTACIAHHFTTCTRRLCLQHVLSKCVLGLR